MKVKIMFSSTSFWIFLTTIFSSTNLFSQTNPPIYIAFLWHMHQPIYYPYENIVQTQASGYYNYSLFDIHNSRTGPYTDWAKNAVDLGIAANMGNFGAQVSFSGSLMENLDNLKANGNGNFSNWETPWNNITTQTTTLGNPRIDLVAFGYHHPLMGLIGEADIRKQIQAHKQIFAQNFNAPYSKGIFPPENAFNEKMIPALTKEGVEWALVDNIHFERACEDYPFNTGGNLYEPNKADVRNPNPNDWIQLNGLWAPTQVSAQWARQPHFVEYTEPNTGRKYKMIAVPTDRYLGNEDGRGGFGALNYETVMSQFEAYNTDPNHPILLVLHHDGDNYGGGTYSYYHNNFQNFVNWLQANPTRFVCTTVQDYLDTFPPDSSDVIHVESGSWSGADNGDPEFKKWLGDPNSNGYSPDRNSWGVVTAAKNFVQTANEISKSNPNTETAWKYLMNAEASDYWYWDNAQGGIWDSHPTRAANQAIQAAQNVIGTDEIAPTIFLPQREPYNPGGTEWGISQTNDLEIWTYVYDKSGLDYVKLKYRTDFDGTVSDQNKTFVGGNEVTVWNEISMTGTFISPQTNPMPLFKAEEFSATLSGLNDTLVDFYIEALDSLGNLAKSPIQHVWIGSSTQSGGGSGSGNISWNPSANITSNDSITITISGANQGAKLHWGVNNQGSNWQTPNQVYWNTGTTLFNNSGPAVETPFVGPDSTNTLTLTLKPFNNSAQIVNKLAFVIHYENDTWDNNNGQDYQISFGGSSSGQTFVMNGQLDSQTQMVSSNNGDELHLGWNGTELYVATQSASSQGNDVFIFISDSPNQQINSPWDKNGTVGNWSSFLGNESTNNWSGWFDNSGNVENSSGNHLEGTLILESEFGTVPAKIYIAVGIYQTADNGNLVSQIPVGNGNSNIETNEFYEFYYVLTDIKNEENLPNKFKLSQNYPNPFNPTTSINYEFQITNYEKGELVIFNILGKKVKEFELKENKGSVVWNGTDSLGKQISSGIYFYRLEVGKFSETRKMLFLK